MNQPSPQASFTPPWFLIVGLLAGVAFVAFILWESSNASAKKVGNGNVIELTDANWQKEVVESDVPVVVDFWAPWCGPCKDLAPTIDSLAERYAGKVKVGKLNIDNAPETAAKYGINGIPHVLLFKGGERPTKSFQGAQHTEAQFARAIDQMLATP